MHSGEAEEISSSAIRRALEHGDIEGATARLGRYYEVSGRVIEGMKLGRQLGVPTANIALPATNRLAYGVYAVRALLGGAQHYGVASFGVRPTVNGVGPLLETYVFDYAGNLYGKEITIQFVARIRGEEKFASLDALQEAMHRDMEKARAALAQ